MATGLWSAAFAQLCVAVCVSLNFTYPRTLTWSLEDHARAILDKLAAHEIRKGWLLAESFGSVLAWATLQHANRAEFKVEGVILAGGFVRYPVALLVRVVRAVNRFMPLWLIKLLCWIYARYAIFRHRNAPETLQDVSEFVRRRSEEADRRAICYRYQLILESDARELTKKATVPVYQICGFVDPVVPWFLVRRWLLRNCRTYREWRVIWRADHNVLGTAPQLSAKQILSWMGQQFE